MEKVDSEVQGFKVCGHCETRVDEALSECPECGAPLQGSGLIDNVSETVHADLSRANLARMRGDYRAAEQHCLSILKRYPHHFETHVLIGDIFADQKQFEQAADWYELAVDLDPGSFIARQKLQVMKDRLRETEKLNTAEHLGLPEMSGKRTMFYSGLALAIIALCAFVSYSLGKQTAKAQPPEVVRAPISATEDSIISKPQDEPVVEEPKVASVPPATQQPLMSAEDKTTTELLRRGQHADRLIQATMDPRTKQLTITYRLQEGDVDRKIGAEMARDALAVITETSMVTVKGLKGDKMAYMADVPRTRLAETQTETWQATAAGPDAWIQYVITNEWFAVPPPTTDAAP
ncbi:MAG: tetratricopeptide repeat protein [Fimbriimonas sp.]